MKWNIVPNGRDEMMGKQVKGKTKFTAYAYRAYSPNFAAPLGPAKIPGPLIEANVGDTITVHFRNKLEHAGDDPSARRPVLQRHGRRLQGQVHRSRRVRPEGRRGRPTSGRRSPETEGAWFYHDHGPMDPLPLYKGLLGPMIIRDPSKPQPDKEFFTAFHSFQPAATGLDRPFYCINGRSYAGNTPTLQAQRRRRRRLPRLRDRRRLPHLPHPRPPLAGRRAARSSTT